MESKEWRAVVGWEGFYEVSNFGSVRSMARIVRHSGGGTAAIRGKILAQATQPDGRAAVVLCRNGQPKNKRVLQLVAEAFIGAKPNGMQVCHNDGNPSNNHASNLRYDTPSGNMQDRIAHGTDARGEKSPLAKLTTDEVIAIRSSNETLAVLAKRYRVSFQHISLVRLKKTWQHL